MMNPSRRGLLAATGLLALSACAPPQTRYQPSGSGIVDIVIPYSSGGGTDTWARFIANHFAERQDDIKRYQVENVPGGESITGTNAYVDTGVTNGQQLLVSSATTYFQNMLGHSSAEFDFGIMEPLALNGTGAVLWAGGDSGIRSLADLLEKPDKVHYAGMSATGLDLVALLALEALGIKVDGVFGFEGRGPTRLAVQRNEAQLDFQTTATYLSQVQPLVDTGEAFPLFTVGVPENGKIVRDPALPDVVTVAEIVEGEMAGTADSRAYEAYEAFVSPGFFYQKGLWSNADTEPSVIDKYDALVLELNEDEEFVEASKSALGGYPLISGRDVRDEFKEALKLSPEVKNYTRDFLINEHDAVLD